MSLYEAFVQELSQLNRGNPDLHCMISDQTNQTIVLEKKNGDRLSVVFGAKVRVQSDLLGVDGHGPIRAIRASMSYPVNGISDEKAIVEIVIGTMRMVDSDFNNHVTNVETRKAARGNRGPRGMDTI